MAKLRESTRDFVHEWSLNILILLFGTTALVQAFIVPTPSMDTTVMVGDHLLVDKLSYAPAGALSKHLLPYTEPKRGDVIVFRYPMDIRQNYVKRVIGVPGDHIRVADKVVYLNGKPLTEPYTQHVFPGIEPYRDNFPSEPYGPVYDRAREMLANHVMNGELVVPPGSYFAMGDNIIGKPLVIFWSYDAPTEDWVGNTGNHYADLFKNFFVKTRWDRTLKLVRGTPIE
jgi:signal peptidase I